ncbi:MAG: DinB family protein [Acidobacteria bacterium]|nr:DinB family protein [Acidobacteriota bacterium]
MKQRLIALRYLAGLIAVHMALGLVGFAQAAGGQAPKPATPAAPAVAAKEWPKERIGGLVAEWTRAMNWTKEYIEKMPEDAMSFKPIPEVRSFSEQMLHLASANFFYGNRGTGAANPYQGKDLTKMEELKTKAGLTKVVMESYDYVIKSLQAMDATKLEERMVARGMNLPRAEFLVMGFEHQSHHRGQTTIYLRMKGVTPPPEPF